MNFRYIMLLVTLFFLSLGELMAQPPLFHLHDQEMEITAIFPQKPLEMRVELPFQNTPPQGLLKIYSLPTHEGLFALSLYRFPAVNSSFLSKEKMLHFFKTVLVPHFFYDPKIFENHLSFNVSLKEEGTAHISLHFEDHGVIKKLEGKGIVKDHTLSIPFYLASENHFNEDVVKEYLDSVLLTPSQSMVPKEK